MKRNSIFAKILSAFLIFLLVFNLNVVSFATNTTTEDQKFEETEEDGVMDGLVGTFSSIIRIPIMLLADGISIVLGMLGTSAGVREGVEVGNRLTPEDVLFNKLLLISINFFEGTEGFGGDGVTGGSGAIQAIRDNVAIWYYAIRNIALAILLCIFIYVAIRMILSTVASDKAVYKKMLEDWIVGIVLLFMLHYIIVGSIMLNNVLVEDVMGGALAASTASEPGAEVKTLGDFTEELRDIAYTVTGWINGRPPSATRTWGAAIVYVMVVFITLTFLYKYIMRMLTIGFLIIISPLITITYSIDKMGDGKSQALNTWLKEFEYNILIQPFHCIMYLVFVKTAIDILDGTLAGMVLAILCMKFIWDGEKIIKNIFGFNNAKSVGDSLVAAAGAVTAMKTVGGLAKNATVGAGGSIKGTGGNGAGGNAALAGAGKNIGGTSAQSPKLHDSTKIGGALDENKKQNSQARQQTRQTFSDPNSTLGQKMGAGAKMAFTGAADAAVGAGKNLYRRTTSTIRGAVSNPGATMGKVVRSAAKGTAKAAFAAIAMGAALATGNIGLIPDAMKAGWNIGGYVGKKATGISERMALSTGQEKFRANAAQTATNLRGATQHATKQTELDAIKKDAAKYRKDEHGKAVNADQAFGEESIQDTLKDYQEHGSGRVNDTYDDALSTYVKAFGAGKEQTDSKFMRQLGSMTPEQFHKELLDSGGMFDGASAEQKAAAYNFYDASQRKNLVDNADRLQGQEMQLGNTDAAKDVGALMEESINPQPPQNP